MKIDAIVLRELHLPLVRPFETSFGITRERRILLAEIQSEGLTGWGECTAGERPFFSEEWTDSAWDAILHELGPMLAAEAPEHGGDCPGIFRQVRGNRMAKATLENAIWDLEAQREGVSLSHLIGGVRETIPCGVSLGIQSSISELMTVIERELAAGYQRIKLKCKPGWDTEVFERVRNRWPGIMLSCDANSAYRLRDADHLATFDAFDLLMIEQPLWHDDFYYHSMLQKRLQTPICLDESIRWQPLRWSRAGSSTSSWAGWVASLRRSPYTTRPRNAGFRFGAAECWNPAWDGRTTSHYLRWKTLPYPAMSPHRPAIGLRTSSSRR